jgi:hypothetical protein
MDKLRKPTERFRRFILLTLIIACAIFFRFYRFTSIPPGLFCDEAMDGNNAVEAVETNSFHVFYVEDNGREGLYVNAIALILKVVPAYEPWVIRFPAAIAGVLTVLGMYLFVAEIFGATAGLFASYLLATSMWHIMFSRIGFRAILAPLMLLWALWLLVKGFRVPKSTGPSRIDIPTQLCLILAGIVYGLGFYTYIAYRITPILLIVFFPFFRKTVGFWSRTALFTAVVCLVAAPIGWYFVMHPGDFFQRTAEISVTGAKNPFYRLLANAGRTALMLNVHGDNNWRHNISGAPELFWPVGLLFLFGFGLAIETIWKRWRHGNSIDHLQSFGSVLIILWIVVGSVPAVASNQAIPHALRSILLLPPSIMLAALGGVRISRIIQSSFGKYAATAIVLIFVAATCAFSYYDYFIVWAANPQVRDAFNASYVEIGRQINSMPSSSPKYVVVEPSSLARGVPVTAETTMFITHSFTITDRAAANSHYLLSDQTAEIPHGTPSNEIFYLGKE